MLICLVAAGDSLAAALSADPPSPGPVSWPFTIATFRRPAADADRAVPEAPQVGCHHAEAIAQRGELRLPQGAVERVAMDEDDAVAAASIVVGQLHACNHNRG